MITVNEIVGLVAMNFGVSVNDILSDSRKEHLSLARHSACWLSRECTTRSYPQIGRVLNRDHTSVMHGFERAEERMKVDAMYRALMSSMRTSISFREKIAMTGGVDVLTVARRIAREPRREAMGASLMEIAALASTVLDLWEVCKAAETLAMTDPSESEEAATLSNALREAIIDEMKALRGDEKEAIHAE